MSKPHPECVSSKAPRTGGHLPPLPSQPLARTHGGASTSKHRALGSRKHHFSVSGGAEAAEPVVEGPFRGLRRDLAVKLPHYGSDIADGLTSLKVVAGGSNAMEIEGCRRLGTLPSFSCATCHAVPGPRGAPVRCSVRPAFSSSAVWHPRWPLEHFAMT